MALKNIIKPHHLMVDGDMSGSLISDAVDVTYTDNVGFQLTFTGTPTGVFSCQGTIDEVNWSSLTFSTTPTADGGDDVHLLNINQIPYKKLRIRYSPMMGTGTLNIYVMSKGLN